MVRKVHSYAQRDIMANPELLTTMYVDLMGFPMSPKGVVSAAKGGGAALMFGAPAAVGATTSAIKAVTFVGQNERGVRTSMGRAVRTKDAKLGKGKAGGLFGIVGPGPHLVVPFTHSIKKIGVQRRNNELGEICVDTQDEMQILVKSAIGWRVNPDGDNPYKALFNVAEDGNLQDSVADICTAGLRNVMDGRTLRQMKDERAIEGDLKDHCKERLQNLGSELLELNLKQASRNGVIVLNFGGRGELSEEMAEAAQTFADGLSQAMGGSVIPMRHSEPAS